MFKGTVSSDSISRDFCMNSKGKEPARSNFGVKYLRDLRSLSGIPESRSDFSMVQDSCREHVQKFLFFCLQYWEKILFHCIKLFANDGTWVFRYWLNSITFLDPSSCTTRASSALKFYTEHKSAKIPDLEPQQCPSEMEKRSSGPGSNTVRNCTLQER